MPTLDHATPDRAAWLRRQQFILARIAHQLWARVRVAQLRFDLWYSERHVAILRHDTAREAVVQADIRRALAHWERAT